MTTLPHRPRSLARPQRSAQLSGQIAKTLRDAIANGAWAPGARLPTERELAEHFDVSRPVIREAMTVLKHDGLVTSRQGAGAFVAARSAAPGEAGGEVEAKESTVLEFVELRRAIEVEAASLAALRRSPADLRRIRSARDALNRKIAAAVDSVEEGFAFHRAIVLASQNTQLVRLLDQMKPLLVGTMRVMRESGPRQAAYTAAVQREHDAVLDAIAAGDAERARHAALTHFEASEGRIRATDTAVWAGTPAAPATSTGKRTRSRTSLRD